MSQNYVGKMVRVNVRFSEIENFEAMVLDFGPIGLTIRSGSGANSTRFIPWTSVVLVTLLD